MTPAAQLRVLRASTSALGLRGFLAPTTTRSLVPGSPASYSFNHASARAYSSPPSSSSSSPSLSSSALTDSSMSALARNTANPPHTTRPPPLELPARSPHQSGFQYLLATGKAYLKFYKTGMGYLWANTKAVRALGQIESSTTTPMTRSDILLKKRWRHDIRTLPIFSVLLLVCGELTPFVVMFFPHLVPYPCRIPKQVDKLRRQVEDRRKAAFEQAAKSAAAAAAAAAAGGDGGTVLPDTSKQIVCSLGLVSPLWDRINWVPSALADARVQHHLKFLAKDDALLRAAGGTAALEPEEVRLACADRGLDVRDVPENDLRGLLSEWLERTRTADRASVAVAEVAAGSGGSSSDAINPGLFRRIELLSTRPSQWPTK